MKIKNKILYHTSVTKEGESFFDKNTHINIDSSEKNPRFSELINFEPKQIINGKEMGWLKYLDYLLENEKMFGQPINWKGLLRNITDISYRLNNRYYEKIFEEIRIKEFSELPSRYSCIYLADKKNIEKWHRKALNQLKEPEFPIYEFKATGFLHYGDEEWLEVDVVSEKEYREIARKYWSGEKHPHSKDLFEILFTGTLTVTNKYKNIDELLKVI